jgi:3-methyladenine DNA glycosylase AlkD
MVAQARTVRVKRGKAGKGVTVEAIAEAIEATLRAEGDARRGVGQKADREKHIPDPPGPGLGLDYLGATVPVVRSTTKAALKAHPVTQRAELLALTERLWDAGIYDLRLAAIDALRVRIKLLEAEDLRVLERLVREAQTWALLDTLSISVLAPLVERYPELVATLDRWAEDGDFWVRRQAMLSLLPALRRGGGDWERFAGYADAMLEEKEFFIRKVIGWVLREVSKKRPELVAEWLAPRTGRASGVTFREAVKYLPPEERERLTAAFKEGRPA